MHNDAPFFVLLCELMMGCSGAAAISAAIATCRRCVAGWGSATGGPRFPPPEYLPPVQPPVGAWAAAGTRLRILGVLGAVDGLDVVGPVGTGDDLVQVGLDGPALVGGQCGRGGLDVPVGPGRVPGGPVGLGPASSRSPLEASAGQDGRVTGFTSLVGFVAALMTLTSQTSPWGPTWPGAPPPPGASCRRRWMTVRLVDCWQSSKAEAWARHVHTHSPPRQSATMMIALRVKRPALLTVFRCSCRTRHDSHNGPEPDRFGQCTTPDRSAVAAFLSFVKNKWPEQCRKRKTRLLHGGLSWLGVLNLRAKAVESSDITAYRMAGPSVSTQPILRTTVPDMHDI